MPSTKCIYDKHYVLLNLVTKKCSCLYMLCQGLYITVYIYRALCNNAGLRGLTRIVIKYQLFVKTNSWGFNCKPDNKNRNPENV